MDSALHAICIEPVSFLFVICTKIDGRAHEPFAFLAGAFMPRGVIHVPIQSYICVTMFDIPM